MFFINVIDLIQKFRSEKKLCQMLHSMLGIQLFSWYFAGYFVVHCDNIFTSLPNYPEVKLKLPKLWFEKLDHIMSHTMIILLKTCDN